MSTNCHQNKSCPIPTKVLLKDLSQLPDLYSSTPGGTLFSTTPGGTRIVYGRKFLLECRNSPLARTPPSYLPQIPGVTMPQHSTLAKVEELKELETEKETPEKQEDDRRYKTTEDQRKFNINHTSRQIKQHFPDSVHKINSADDAQFEMDI
ncbi:eukaryotic translation initiation factor 4E-binding protein 3-like isoform X1 [Carcharodon carcharias]|uniref:eukaryotic translation initiation factor 4E-binding protein 3-like isoform X1 n=1 Tax=Carcharodon carcharias TaxID=13397 RepID=UPI001B7E21B8|nr:eukaryotic translation initiation factor 4E-binding protein 3-like isoform X1 [Carcharodon carcharias]